MTKDKVKYISIDQESSPSYLDTLELTAEIFQDKTHERLYYSALRKDSTISKLKGILDVTDRKYHKDYWKAYHCNSTLFQDGTKLIGSLCRKRWCHNCNRIKTAEMINGYQKPLQELEAADLFYLVTLTAPTVEERQLKAEIVKRYQSWKRVKDRLRKQGITIQGIRKLECTLSKGKYHPHFHLLIQGKAAAELFLKYWLEEFPTAKIVGQDIRPIQANGKDLVEVFKYAVKEFVKDETTAYASHIIYQALKGKRVFQSFGKIRKVKEPKEEKTEVEQCTFLKPKLDIWYYQDKEIDYVNAYGEIAIDTKYITEQIKIKADESSKRKERISNDTRQQETN
jgi:hypothetical protein